MRKVTLLLIAAGLMLGIGSAAQTKKETAQFKKTVQKFSIKAADKFLKKFPESVYTVEINRLKDSVTVSQNTSSISHEDALAKAGACLDAMGWKKDGKEHILALDEGLRLRVLGPDGSLQETRYIPHYNLTDRLSSLSLIKPLEIINLGHNHFYLHFSYLNEGEGSPEKEYVEVLYSPDTDIANNAMFYGTGLSLAEGERYRIEGQSPESIEGITLNSETAWLLERLNEDTALVRLSKADLLTDESIKWWLGKNPKAGTSATKLTFGTLDSESSLVEKYSKNSRERGKSWNAAMFDCRGWRVIVAANKSTGSYALVWAEPAGKGGGNINNISFESDGITLELIYFKAKRMSKVKISMANGAVRR